MAEVRKTSLNAGLIIRKILMESEAVTQRTKKIFPIVIDKAELPYILYRRAALEHNPTKAGQPGADTVQMEVNVYTAAYSEGVELAEAVRAALDYAQGEISGLKMRSCTLTDSEEGWEDDACVQNMTFTIKL
ncbi:DUF3168 domain-containing protein [Prevotella sp. OH937_COT-195]|uniref:tail completion protein gp17 n=1 Tax=Prevotella sp. OH937_COT-195 TaxID=2491051 RepID=UPI000F64792E|nr:DUF3168 domain-containing protein [Prevotella sp. OH937_COT-195]